VGIVANLIVNVNKLNPMPAGCHIKVPRKIATRRAVISVHTNNACFAWSVVTALYPAESIRSESHRIIRQC